jgi:uncharacterized protein (TIGR02118 family)
MAMIIAMYKAPTDPAEFDRYYFGPHVTLAKTVPGLKGYRVTRGPIMAMAGPQPYYLIAVLSFESMEAVQAALASKEGQAVAADLANFATGGVEVFFSESEKI